MKITPINAIKPITFKEQPVFKGHTPVFQGHNPVFQGHQITDDEDSGCTTLKPVETPKKLDVIA